MSYLGRVTNKSSDIRRIDITSSTSATHTLTWTAPNEQSLIVTINGVKQQNNYTVSGTTLTLDTALISTDKLEVIGINDIGTTITPAEGSVNTSQLANDSVATAKIQDDAVTADKLANSINTDIAANTAKVTNATHTGDVTGATALTIAADAVTPAKMADSAYLANRNMIINGAMQISQRGTSEASLAYTSYGYYKAPDRFRASIEVGTWTVSQSSEAPEGFANSYKFDCTTADASPTAAYATQLGYRIEAQDLQNLKYGTSNAETVTLSFWVRSAKTGTYIVELRHGETSISNSIAYTISVADTWEKKELSFSGYVTTAINDDNGIGLYVNFWLVAGSDYTSGTLAPNTWQSTAANKAVGQVNLADSTSNDWHLTGVQLEIGSEATPFERKTYNQELQACLRYYQIVSMNWWSYAISASVIDSFVRHTPYMRASPSVTLLDTSPTFQKVNVANYTGSSSSITTSSNTDRQAFVRIDGFSGLSSNSYYLLVQANMFAFLAEL